MDQNISYRIASLVDATADALPVSLNTSQSNTHKPQTPSTGKADQNINKDIINDKRVIPKGKAVFVRFAVVTRTEKSLVPNPLSGTLNPILGSVSGISASQSMTSLASNLSACFNGSQTSQKSAEIYSPFLTSNSSVSGGVVVDEPLSGAQGVTVHNLPCSSTNLSEGLHSLCTSLGQVLELSAHPTAAAPTEIAIRMVRLLIIHMYVNNAFKKFINLL